MQTEESCKIVELNRLKNFPIMMFAVIMGLSGLSIVYKKHMRSLVYPLL